MAEYSPVADSPVLVTGASGFLAKHVILALLREGHAVRAGLRSPARAAEVRQAVLPHLPAGAERRLGFVPLDLMQGLGWTEAMAGAGALIHTASPFPIAQPKDPDLVIRPAVEGTRRAFRAAAAAGVRRVILTSSTVAVLGPRRPGHVHTEADWADAEGLPATPYARSKVLAERAAWEIAAAEGLALTAINPAFLLGPPLDSHFGASIALVQRMLRGRDPMVPRLGFPVVDVRDAALAHLRALERPETAGERFIVAAGPLWLTEWGRILKSRWPDRRMPTRAAPKPLLRLLALFDGEIRAALPGIGHCDEVSAEKAKAALGLDFTRPDRALLAAAEVLVSRGLA